MLKKPLVNGILSAFAASDRGYMKCRRNPSIVDLEAERLASGKHPKAWKPEFYTPSAVHKYNQAENVKEGVLMGYSWPRPDDPSLMCQLEKWAFEDDWSHEAPWPALVKLENFADNEFNFTRKGFQQEAFDSYVRVGNNHEIDWTECFFVDLKSVADSGPRLALVTGPSLLIIRD